MQQSIMMMNIPDVIGKRDVKREFKAAGYGSIDTIVFEPESFRGYKSAYIWFRPTEKESVQQKRLDLQNNCGTYENYIDICCEKTPRANNECNNRWYILPNEERAEPPVFTEKTQSQLNQTDFQIQTLTDTVERQTHIILQLLGGLYCQDRQSNSLSYWETYLLNGEHKELPIDEHNWPTTRQGDALETQVKGLSDTYERKLAAVEKRFENIERQIPSHMNDTYERKLAALEKRFDDFEFQLPSPSPPNDTYDRKLAALEKQFEGLYREMSNTASFVNHLDYRVRNAAHCLTKDL